MSAVAPPPETNVPRVLLFGHRGSGKSALIGALLKAGETQGETLRGEVVHSSGDLPRLRDAVYSGGKLEAHTTDLVSYTIRLKPWRVEGKPVGDPLTVVLDDCDGRAAEELLERPEPITRRAANSPVARAVIETDAIVLLVDAASTDAELAEAFAEFDTFLTVVERAKTDAREVGGFPIYLVLTQCDRLARPGDTRDAWEDRVDARIAHASHKFSEYLKEAGEEADEGAPSPFLAFGSVEFEVFAVAVRAPALPDAPTTADLPYKVAELFRDCFAAARAHNDRARASDVRLKWTVRLAAVAVSVMLTVLALVALFPPRNDGPTLTERVQDYLAGEPPAAERLSEARIERNKATLAIFKADREFRSLDPELRQFVESRLKEIDDYKLYRGKLLSAPAPASCRSLPDLNAVRDALTGELALPPEYAWAETAAGELRRKWLADCAAITDAEKKLVDAYREYDGAATALTLRRSFDVNWLDDIGSLVARGDQPPFPLSDPLPGSFAIKQPGGEVVDYRVPYEFDEVYHARRYWEQSRDRLTHLRDLAYALGVFVIPNAPPAVLDISEPDGDSAALAGARLAELKRAYPRQSEGYPEWDVRSYPDPARSDHTARQKKSFGAGVRHVNVMLRPEDTKDGWKTAATKLNAPAYREWGRLLHLLARLQNPTAPDPIAELANFLTDLDTKTFDIDAPAFELVVPLDFTVGFERALPKDALTITLTHGTEPPVVVKYTVGPGATRDKTTVYRLTREGSGKLPYRAGDEFRAELPVDAGKQQLKLVWETSGSNTFRFDRLSREPRLTRATGGTDVAPGVRLVPVPGSVMPKLPALMTVK